MKQNNTKTLETLRLKLLHHKGIYPDINSLLKIKTVLTLFQPSSTQSNTKTRVFKLNYNIILNLLLIRSNISLLQTNQSQTQKLANFQVEVMKDGLKYTPVRMENLFRIELQPLHLNIILNLTSFLTLFAILSSVLISPS